MASPPSSPSRAPLINQELGDSTSELMDTFDVNGPNNDRAEGSGQMSFPTYGSVQAKDDQQAPPLPEKLKKKHRASSVVSLSSFGDVSVCLQYYIETTKLYTE